MSGSKHNSKKIQIHLVCFGNNDYERTKIRMVKQAKTSGWFDDIHIYGESQLTQYNKSFAGRGGGYWWWKPIIILDVLSKINYNDILVYIDAGSSINLMGRERFFQYIELVSLDYDFLGFYLGDSVEKHWTKRDLFIHMGLDSPKYTDTPQLVSGSFLLRKTNHTISIMEEYNNICEMRHLVDDTDSVVPNYPGFIEHRHDQSALSLLYKKYNLKAIPDETYGSNIQNCPIHSTRIKDYQF